MAQSSSIVDAEVGGGALSELVGAVLSPVKDVAEAQARTRALAHGHYENFSVISVLLPRYLRQDFCNIYAFCRAADDLGDEIGDREKSLALLGDLKEQTRGCYAALARGSASGGAGGQTALFAALGETIRRYDIPIEPFLALIDAFEQDQRITRYDTFDGVLDYCRRSADPVGRLVLYLCEYRDPERQRFSDLICSGLQLANFWQDVRRDLLERDRIYLPRESMDRFGVSERDLSTQIAEDRCDEGYRRLIRFEVDRTEAMFGEGAGLMPLLRPRVRGQIALFLKGGRAILEAIRRRNYDTITGRPALSKMQKGRLIAGTLVSSALAKLRVSGQARGGEVRA